MINAGAGDVTVVCDQDRNGGGWTQVVNDDYASGAPCPAAFVDNALGCLRPGGAVSTSATFPVPVAFTQVMGSIQGIANANLDAFDPGGNALDVNYVDGVSVTAGAPRSHLFTLAASHVDTDNDCPCVGGPGAKAFVGTRFVCDRSNDADSFDLTTPLWDDAMQCLTTGVIDRFWLSDPLPSETLDAIEVRLLVDQDAGDENIAIAHVELYVR